METSATIKVFQCGTQSLGRHHLVLGRHSGDDFKALGISLFTVFVHHHLTSHFSHIQRVFIYLSYRTLKFQLFSISRIGLGFSDHALLSHIVQNIALTLLGTLVINDRIECRWCFRQPRQHCWLGQTELLNRLVIIRIRSCGKTVRALTQIYLIKIQL